MAKTNYQAGHDAEKAAAEYLKINGYKILAINWKTPRCEVDIIARKYSTIYFVEVKYRSSNRHGAGLDYITPQKLQQMEYAARSWVQANQYDGDYELSALEISGEEDGAVTFLQHIL